MKELRAVGERIDRHGLTVRVGDIIYYSALPAEETDKLDRMGRVLWLGYKQVKVLDVAENTEVTVPLQQVAKFV